MNFNRSVRYKNEENNKKKKIKPKLILKVNKIHLIFVTDLDSI